MAVQFTRRQSPYQSGDIAGFDAEIERRLVQSGVAVYYTKPVDTAPLTAEVLPAPTRTPRRRSSQPPPPPKG